jgi:hypothetical protein
MNVETEAQLCTHGEQMCRQCDRYWWHKAIADHLVEIGSAMNVHAIASNLRMSRGDVEKYARQMIGWGELAEVAPVFDYPALWVGLS